MNFVLACIPVGVVLALMLRLKWGAHKAGAAGWLAAVVAGGLSFGLTFEVFWISQVKGLLLSIYVLLIMWPALFLFHWLNRLGAIEAVTRMLQRAVPEPGLFAIALAWCLSGAFEGIAGFGLPVAIVAPMLLAAGVQPIRAVAAVAIGHSWAVTFGSMGLIFQTLSAISGISSQELVPWTATLLGAACIGCGLGAALVLGQSHRWKAVILVALLMASVQFAVCYFGLSAMGSFAAGLAGLLACAAISRRTRENSAPAPARTANSSKNVAPALACYGSLALMLAALTFVPPLRIAVENFRWQATFTRVATGNGFVTPAGKGPAFLFLTHPGSLMILVALVAVAAAFWSNRQSARETFLHATRGTLSSGGLATVGVLFMVGMAGIMDHCGMTLLLAEAVSGIAGSAYPLVSPFIGVLGAFATGSNNNSNIMFATLQKSAAEILRLSPALILAGQTAGGSLGSMVAPAKLVIGCSTAGLTGQEGAVLRKTIGPLLALIFIIGLILLALAR